MNEGAPVMYQGGGFGASAMYMVPGQVERQLRSYQAGYLGSNGNGSPSLPRRDQPRREAHSRPKPDNTAFGYDSDDSSLSSNASGSNKSSDKGESTPHSGSLSTGPARDYRRGRRRPPDRYLHAAYPYQIRYAPDDLLNGSEWDTLSQEIWDMFVKSQQTEETFRKKMNLWKYLYVSIKTIFPRYSLYVVGSTLSGFALDASDMDLCLYVRPHEAIEPRTHAILHLGFILNYVRTIDPEAELIQAKVPILKFRDGRHQLQVDLNCNNVVGIRNTNLLYTYCRLDWRVRPLVVVAKRWAGAHGINDARRCTLSSYALTLMVIHFLQCGVRPAVLPCVCVRGGGGSVRGGASGRGPRHSLAELFLGLLSYYAHFPWERMAVSVRAGRALPVAECRAARSHKNDPSQWKLLCVEEPFDLSNTARSVYDPDAFRRIVNVFKESAARLAVSRRLADAWPR